MKCISCKKKTQGDIIVCPSCRSINNFVNYLRCHRCQSFIQEEGGRDGYCKNYLSCTPIKKALKKEMLIGKDLLHVICPYPSENLSRIIYGHFTVEDIKRNYSECL